MYRIPLFLAFFVAGALMAQSPDQSAVTASSRTVATAQEEALTTEPTTAAADESGLQSYVDFSGNSNSLGHMLTWGLTLGYRFNRQVSVDAQVPFYYVSASTTTTTSTGESVSTTTTDQGIADPSFALRIQFPNQFIDYGTRVTTWVPVADMNSGFTTGSVLVDWTNRFSRPVGRLFPFGQVDIANTVPDTPMFILPYTAEGFNARFEGGADTLLTKVFSAGASFYYVLPSGTQTLYSREIHVMGAGSSGTGGGSDGTGGGTGGSGSGTGSGKGGMMLQQAASGSGGGSGSGSGMRDGFMIQQVTEGNDITRDHGVGVWLGASLSRFMDVQLGFDHSFGYDLDTFSFGVGFDPLRIFGRRAN